MNSLLINEQPLQALPSLAVELESLDEAVILQQLHYWLSRSTLVRDGHKWVYNSIDDWQKQFPWIKSRKTLSKHFNSLEKRGLIITGNFNKKKFDKTKWYRLDYDAISQMGNAMGNNYPTNGQDLPKAMGNNYPKHRVKTTQPIPETTHKITHKTTTENYKGQAQPATLAAQRREVIEYLNQKTDKNFKPDADGNKRIINPRLKEGYTVSDLKRIIDVKYAEWHGITFRNGQPGDNYLKPETLFRPSNIEGYNNQQLPSKQPRKRTPYGHRHIEEPLPDWAQKPEMAKKKLTEKEWNRLMFDEE